MCRRFRIEPFPVNAGRQPVPLRDCECKCRLIRSGPCEVSAMQSSLAQPYAGAIPDQKLDAIAVAIPECVGRTVAGGALQSLLDLE